MEPAIAAEAPSAPGNLAAELQGSEETLLITLYGRALDYISPNPILGDKWTIEILERAIGGPLAMAEKLWGAPATVSSVALRTSLLDGWTADFLGSHAEATVLHLACGLDTRALRLQDKCGPGIRWVDIDLPRVMELRKKLEIPAPENVGEYKLVGASVEETEWLEEIPGDRPVAVVLEGLTMFLKPEVGQGLIKRIVGHFPSGQIAFDMMPSIVMASINLYVRLRGSWDFRFGWAIDYPKDVEALDKRLKLKESLLICEAPGIAKLPLWRRVLSFCIWFVPYARSIGSYGRYEFQRD